MIIYINTNIKHHNNNYLYSIYLFCVGWESKQLNFLKLKLQLLSYKPPQTIALEV